MSYIDKDATLAAIANKAKAELADVNHYFLEGVQLAVDVVEGMTEAEPVTGSHDLIDRQAAIDALAKVAREKFNLSDEFNHYLAGLMDGEYAIRQLPSAQPERKTGRWIYGEDDIAMCDGYRCNKCGFFVPWDYQHKGIDFIKDYHYCPSCKAKMLIYTGANMEVEHDDYYEEPEEGE